MSGIWELEGGKIFKTYYEICDYCEEKFTGVHKCKEIHLKKTAVPCFVKTCLETIVPEIENILGICPKCEERYKKIMTYFRNGVELYGQKGEII